MLPEELQDSLYVDLAFNESKRIIHEYEDDGSICSLDKEPCMVVTRKTDGLVYFCQRCGDKGFVNMNNLAPKDVAKVVKNIICKDDVAKSKIVKNMELPYDAMPIEKENKEVPWEALAWFMQYGLDPYDYEVYWSTYYQRVLFPIYGGEELVGWVGRRIYEEGSKYITRKKEGHERLLFRIGSDPGNVVFTEDIISAIKVHEATGFTCIALLTTHITVNTVRPYKKAQMYLWLDGDMMTKSVKKVQSLCQFGCKIKSIRTELDPKKYTKYEIREYLL